MKPHIIQAGPLRLTQLVTIQKHMFRSFTSQYGSQSNQYKLTVCKHAEILKPNYYKYINIKYYDQLRQILNSLIDVSHNSRKSMLQPLYERTYNSLPLLKLAINNTHFLRDFAPNWNIILKLQNNIILISHYKSNLDKRN